MAIEFPKVRGVRYAYSNIETTLIIDGKASLIVLDIMDINYADSVERELLYGQDAAPVGQTEGVYTPGELKLTMSKQAHAALIDLLGDGYYDARMNFVVKYSGRNLPLITDTIEGCQMSGSENAHASGPAALVVGVPFTFLTLLLNGKTPLTNHLR